MNPTQNNDPVFISTWRGLAVACLCALLAACSTAADNPGVVIRSVAPAGGSGVVLYAGNQSRPLTGVKEVEGTVNGAKLLIFSRREGYLYLLLDITRPEAGCPGGVSSIVWLKINPAWKIVEAKSAVHESCARGIHTDHELYSLTEEHLWMTYKDGRTTYTLNYDGTSPVPGFTVVEEKPR